MNREKELMSSPHFWGFLVKKGSKVLRQDRGEDSARAIIDYIIANKTDKMALAIQKDMVDDGKKLNETAAGQEVQDQLQRQRQEFDAALQEMREQLQEAIRQRDREHREAVESYQKELEQQMNQYQEDIATITMDKEGLKDRSHWKRCTVM